MMKDGQLIYQDKWDDSKVNLEDFISLHTYWFSGNVLAVDVYVVTLKFLLHTVERERIDVFAIDDRCFQGRHDYAVTQ